MKGSKKHIKKDVVALNSKEMKQLVDNSIADMNHLHKIVKKSGLDSTDVRTQLESLYLQNLKAANEPVAVAKRLLAEGLTRMELQKMLDTEEEFISKEFKQNVKLTTDLLKLVKDMQPREYTFQTQVDDDKMIFDISDGVYEQ